MSEWKIAGCTNLNSNGEAGAWSQGPRHLHRSDWLKQRDVALDTAERLANLLERVQPYVFYKNPGLHADVCKELDALRVKEEKTVREQAEKALHKQGHGEAIQLLADAIDELRERDR